MVFEYNGIPHNYPSTLGEITLQQRIEFHLKYGMGFEERLKEVAEIEDPGEKAIEEAEAKILFAVQSFSFFTGINLEEVKENIDLAQVMNVYNASLALLLAEESEIELRPLYEFNNKQWELKAPETTPQSSTTFNEFLVSKEIVRQLEQFSKGKWQALLYLCCIYLRQPGEEFDEEFTTEGSERMTTMLQLPMDIALAVGFFLSSSMNTYLNTLQSSSQAPERE